MFGNPDDNNGQPQPQDAQAPAPDAQTMSTGQPTPGAPAAPAEPVDQTQTTSYGSNDQLATQPPAGPQPDAGSPNPDELLNIKQQALQQLSPLVGHLDQTPEEEFRTTMMMIQASDEQTLVQKAYEAAQKIEDEKTRARALLDIVNEINYFTQHHDSEDSTSSNEE